MSRLCLPYQYPNNPQSSAIELYICIHSVKYIFKKKSCLLKFKLNIFIKIRRQINGTHYQREFTSTRDVQIHWGIQTKWLNQKQFCDQKGLSLFKFKYWITKYNKLKTSSFIPLHVKENQPSNSYRIDLPNGIVIHLTGSEGLTLISELISHVSDQ